MRDPWLINSDLAHLLILKLPIVVEMPSTGLEPVTPRLGIWCSIQMSYEGSN